MSNPLDKNRMSVLSSMIKQLALRLAISGSLSIGLFGQQVAAAVLQDPLATAGVTFGNSVSGLPPALSVGSNFNPAVTGCAAAGGTGGSSPCGISVDPANPYVVATAQTDSPSGYQSFMATSFLQYQIQIDGPAMSDIPLLMKGNLRAVVVASENPIAQGVTADLLVHNMTQSVDLLKAQAEACTVSGGCGPVSESITINTVSKVNSHDIITVTMDAGLTLGSAKAAQALVDPYFQIDPSFPFANQFSISVSPGIGNTVPTSVPEPSAVILIMTGTTLLALVRRRRNSSSFEARSQRE
jgi:hypothetical protein